MLCEINHSLLFLFDVVYTCSNITISESSVVFFPHSVLFYTYFSSYFICIVPVEYVRDLLDITISSTAVNFHKRSWKEILWEACCVR